MARKAAARGRRAPGRPSRSGGRTARKSAARATSRTGKKTASARDPHSRTAVAQRGRPRKVEVHAADRELKLNESRIDQVRGAHTEEEEDLDWLNEDEDPRSQIVEDDDEEWEARPREQW